MKKIFFLGIFICLGSLAFSQNGLDLELGFQYGMAREFDNGETLRKLTEPGVLLTFRMIPQSIGFFGRIGLLFPSRVTEGDLTLTYKNYNYILFINGGLGAGFKVPLNSRFSFLFDAGISINDFLYGGSYKDTIDASWTIKLENLGTTMTGGYIFENIKMEESYNDISFGLLGNAAMRFNFTNKVFMELGVAASFDFLRVKTYEFSADLTDKPEWPDRAKATFPADKLDDPDNPKKLILSSDSKFSVFKQFTFIPSISVGFSF